MKQNYQSLNKKIRIKLMKFNHLTYKKYKKKIQNKNRNKNKIVKKFQTKNWIKNKIKFLKRMNNK